MAQEDFRRRHPPSPREDRPETPDHGHRRRGAGGGDVADGAKTGETPAKRPTRADPDDGLQTDTQKSIDELASLQDELDKAKDHALRCRAEMENFKKRLSRQAEEERQYACLPIMQDLLPVLDNMDRAIEAAANTESGAGLREGFQMVAQQLRGVLAKYDCREIDALGKPFDPNCHEAVSQMASNEFPAHTVVTVVEPGYQLYDRVVRPSKVIVSTRPDEKNTDV